METSILEQNSRTETAITVEPEFEPMTFAVRLGATHFFALLNGFFVAAVFAFVTVVQVSQRRTTKLCFERMNVQDTDS
jgi:hypothetical protein